MKVTYDEKTNSDFTPFRLTLEFETKLDLDIFFDTLENERLNSDHLQLIKQIHDVIRLKISK